MNTDPPWQGFPLYATLCALLIALAVLTSATQAQNSVANQGVQNRMATMKTARSEIEILANMMAGRVRFDRASARAARKGLIASTRSIPSVFEKPHGDPLSRARPDIWMQWDDFKARSNTAKRAARALKVYRLEALRATLPEMIHACLNCHQAYRSVR